MYIARMYFDERCNKHRFRWNSMQLCLVCFGLSLTHTWFSRCFHFQSLHSQQECQPAAVPFYCYSHSHSKCYCYSIFNRSFSGCNISMGSLCFVVSTKHPQHSVVFLHTPLLMSVISFAPSFLHIHTAHSTHGNKEICQYCSLQTQQT